MNKRDLAIDAAKKALPPSLHLPDGASVTDWLYALARDHAALRRKAERQAAELGHVKRAYLEMHHIFSKERQ